ncbi:MAG: phage tail protein [Mesorhizobium sp.]|uniref:phage tail protein n=1 Tax=Mesorhizobium sp. TaxID=1871066 RepID=UPI000FE86C20|nr:phage tail protein [Mesorhizobium sp.]RWC91640.1 MAG: phage tail protein [Mesorhizobium sp.]
MTALMSLGPVVFDLVTNLTEHQKKGESAFAKHEVVGSAPIYETMGENEGTFTLTGVIHPAHFGGLGTLATLEAARLAAVPLPLMRGDYTPVGWVLIQGLSELSGYLDEKGVGREVQFSVELLRVGSPGVGMASSILRLFL